MHKILINRLKRTAKPTKRLLRVTKISSNPRKMTQNLQKSFSVQNEFLMSSLLADLENLREDPYNMTYNIINFEDFDDKDKIVPNFESKIGRDGELNIYSLAHQTGKNEQISLPEGFQDPADTILELCQRIFTFSRIFSEEHSAFRTMKFLGLSVTFSDLCHLLSLLPGTFVRKSQFSLRVENILQDDLKHSFLTNLKKTPNYKDLLSRAVIQMVSESLMGASFAAYPLLTFYDQNDLYITFHIISGQPRCEELSFKHGFAKVSKFGALEFSHDCKFGWEPNRRGRLVSTFKGVESEQLMKFKDGKDAYIVLGPVWIGAVNSGDYFAKIFEICDSEGLGELGGLVRGLEVGGGEEFDWMFEEYQRVKRQSAPKRHDHDFEDDHDH